MATRRRPKRKSSIEDDDDEIKTEKLATTRRPKRKSSDDDEIKTEKLVTTRRRPKRKSSDDDEIKTEEVYEPGTINDPTLMKICTQAKVPFTKTLRDTCKTLVKKVVEKNRCATRQSLEYIANLLQVTILPKVTKKSILTQLLVDLEDPSKSCDIKEEIISAAIVEIGEKVEKQEEKIVQESNLINIKSEKTIAVADYEYQMSHPITIVPVPKKDFFSNRDKVGTWTNHLGRDLGMGTGQITCKNCAFYFSTGQSNPGKNFPETWFPFGRSKTTEPSKYNTSPKGWIHKMVCLHDNPKFIKALESRGIQINSNLMTFLEKFSHWWQVGVSAALPSGPNSVWLVHKEFIFLKHLALTTTYYDSYDLVLKDKGESDIITQYVLSDEEKRVFTQPQDLNLWLKEKDALCYRDEADN